METYMHYLQAGETYRSMTQREKDSLLDNMTESLMFVDEEIQRKIAEHVSRADEELGTLLIKGLGL